MPYDTVRGYQTSCHAGKASISFFHDHVVANGFRATPTGITRRCCIHVRGTFLKVHVNGLMFQCCQPVFASFRSADETKRLSSVKVCFRSWCELKRTACRSLFGAEVSHGCWVLGDTLQVPMKMAWKGPLSAGTKVTASEKHRQPCVCHFSEHLFPVKWPTTALCVRRPLADHRSNRHVCHFQVAFICGTCSVRAVAAQHGRRFVAINPSPRRIHTRAPCGVRARNGKRIGRLQLPMQTEDASKTTKVLAMRLDCGAPEQLGRGTAFVLQVERFIFR